MATDFDYIIAGGGCAGLSLAYCLSKSTLANKRILIIDKEIKTQNDRTWCFWTDEITPFDHIVFRNWQQIEFVTETYQEIYPLKNLHYKIIRGIDFYAEVQAQLAKFSTITFLQDEILQVEEEKDKIIVKTVNHSYSGTWIFDSRISPQVYQSAKRTLLQHFKGYVINTPQPVFDTKKVTMFDFRLPQNNEVRFVYTLPYSPQQALVEFTVFGKKVYEDKTIYSKILQDYLREQFKITEYEIEEEEFGVIPMTDFSFSSKNGQRVKNIGILGGNSKPSTGYTFLNIQRDSVKTVQSLENTGQPFYKQSINPQFKLYDKMILDIMLRDGSSIKKIFTHLFRNNDIETILYFLDNQTHFGKDLQIMASVPPFPFLQSLLNIVKMKG